LSGNRPLTAGLLEIPAVPPKGQSAHKTDFDLRADCPDFPSLVSQFVSGCTGHIPKEKLISSFSITGKSKT